MENMNVGICIIDAPAVPVLSFSSFIATKVTQMIRAAWIIMVKAQNKEQQQQNMHSQTHAWGEWNGME